jgi:hypothetical protein
VSWFKKSAGDVLAPPATEADAPPPPEAGAPRPTVEPLTADEVAWVRSTIAELADQDVRVDDIDDLGRHYDELLAGWLRLRQSDRPDPDKIIDGIGLAFGQYLADQAGLRWAVVTDATGPVIALHREQGEVLLFPTTMVTELWTNREAHVLPSLARVTLRSVALP